MHAFRNAFGPLLLATAGLAAMAVILRVDVVMLGSTSVAFTLVAVATSVAVVGLRGPPAIVGAVVGRELAPVEARAVRTSAHSVLCAGIVTGLVAVLMLLVSLEKGSPAHLASLLVWALNAPAVGLLLGRVWLGALADRCGEADSGSDGFVFGALVVAAAAIFGVSIPV